MPRVDYMCGDLPVTERKIPSALLPHIRSITMERQQVSACCAGARRRNPVPKTAGGVEIPPSRRDC